MLVELSDTVRREDVESLRRFVSSHGGRITEVTVSTGRYAVCTSERPLALEQVGALSGVRRVYNIPGTYKFVSRLWRSEPTRIELGDGVQIGEGTLTVIAGPCSIESEEQVARAVEFLASQGVRTIRGGAFKPRSSPYSFRGLGIEGLRVLRSAANQHRMKIVSEVMENAQIKEMYDLVDVFQVGARNFQNFSLLHELGRIDKPVLLKRGISGTIEELLQSAEYVFSNGNERLMLCERGIRTFEPSYRNTLDLNAVPVLKERSHLPVIVDPSHGVGVRRFVPSMAAAAVMAGADGVMLEVHERPDEALSDGQQSLDYEEASKLFRYLDEVFALRERW